MLRLVAGLLVILGAIAGTVSDPPLLLPLSERGAYKIVEADLHVHSHLGDGILSPFSLVLQARHQGLHAIAITDHNQILAGKWARWFSNLIGGSKVLFWGENKNPVLHLIGGRIS